MNKIKIIAALAAVAFAGVAMAAPKPDMGGLDRHHHHHRHGGWHMLPPPPPPPPPHWGVPPPPPYRRGYRW